MQQNIVQLALVVRDYDEAIDFYTQKLKFDLIEDTHMSETKRWVVVAPPGWTGCRLLLAKAATAQQEAAIGNQTGGRVFLFLHTDNFSRDYDNLVAHGIKILRSPVHQPYGTMAVFKDLYGKLWDLIEPK